MNTIDTRLLAEAYEDVQQPEKRTKDARLIVSFDCPRSCPTCCNKSDYFQSLMKPVGDVKELAGYRNVSLTGGEPLLYPEKTLEIARGLKSVGVGNVYLYTALYTPIMPALLQVIDGVQFSIHSPCDEKEAGGYLKFQKLIKGMNKTFRTFIDTAVDTPLTIIPNVWTRIMFGPMTAVDDCPLPQDETLYYWTDNPEDDPLKQYVQHYKSKEGQAELGESSEYNKCFCMHCNQPF